MLILILILILVRRGMKQGARMFVLDDEILPAVEKTSTYLPTLGKLP